MPTLPWTVPNAPGDLASALVMASRFEVRSLKDVPRFFVKSLAAWRQVKTAPGCLGASLVARPFKRTFMTLSAWDDRDSLMTFNATEPHRGIVTAIRPTMKQSTFVFWNVATGDLPISWTDAERRIAEKAAQDAGGPAAAPGPDTAGGPDAAGGPDTPGGQDAPDSPS